MSVNEKLGRDIKFKWNDNVVGDVNTADLSVENNLVEVINDSSGEWTEQIVARKSWNMSLSVDLTEWDSPSGSYQDKIVEDVFSPQSSGSVGLEPESPETGDVTYNGDVVISSFSISKSTDDIITADFEFQGNGELVRSVES